MTSELRTGSVAKHIQDLVTDFKSKSLEIEELELEVKLLKADAKQLEEVIIPEAMMEAGVTQLTLMTGDDVEIKPFYFARLFAENPAPFFYWLRENGFGGLIKEQIACVPTSEDAQLLIDFLVQFNIYHEVSSTIHWKTLEAWFKECMEAGVKLPLELFQNYTGQRAKIKSKK